MNILANLSKTALSAGLLLACGQSARCIDIYAPVPLTPGSFNADVVVERTAAPPIENYATACPDGGTNLTGNVWFEQGWYPASPVPGTISAWGLPPHNTTFTAEYLDANNQLQVDGNHVYKMPPDYTTNNALFVSKGNGPTAATITIASPAPFAALSFLNSSGNGAVPIDYQVNHQDGTFEVGSFSSTDWFHGNGAAPFPVWMAHCLMSIEGGNLQQIGGNNGSLYNNDITLTNTTSPVVSITFSNAGTGGRMNLFGISGSSDGVAFTSPLDLTGFNADMIIESNAPNFSVNIGACTATMERGTNLWGRVYFEKGFGGQNNYGMPPAGTTFTNAAGDHAFTLAPSYTAANAMAVCSNGWGPPGGSFVITAPRAISTLALLGASTWGPKYVDVTVHHQDGTSETSPQVPIPDWFNSNGTIPGTYPAVLALVAAAGFETDNSGFDTGNTANYRLFAIDIPIGNTVSPVTRVDLAYNTDLNVGNSPSGVTFIFGLAGSPVYPPLSSNPALPLTVTGYNEDMVVERTAVLHPYGLYNATTASMDGGTNNNGSTWYEAGYYRQFPATGLPAANSIIHSMAQPSAYQMPASYTANNAAYVDAAHPSANLTPATPLAYTALSILSSDANGMVTNQVIMQYADGTQDTNGFISQDWFNATPYAFTSQGRVNLDSASINNDPGHNGGNPTSNPRLYEAQIGLNNTTSPLTNIVLNYLGAQNATSGRMVVFAVSGATAPYPVIIRSTAQNISTGMEGTNLVLWCTTAGGAEPITYNWQVQSNGVWMNLVDGAAGVSGSTTLTNTIATYTGWMTNAGSPINGACLLRLQAANAAATVYSSTITVNLRSSYPDLPSAGDPVANFGGDGRNFDAGAPGMIDHLVGTSPDCKDLVYFATTVNPVNVGFTTTPSVGSSIAQAIRIYTANDSQGRDPTSVVLDGSNDGGNTWFNVLPQQTVALSATRNTQNPSQTPNPLTQQMQEFDFYTNASAFTTYRVTFPTVNTPSGNMMQVGEVEILGRSLNTAAPFFTVQPPPAEKVFAGASPTFTVVAGGAPTLRYQWYSNNVAVANATSPTFQVSNVQLANSGNQFYCTVRNANGSINSTTVTLTVVPQPTRTYPLAVLGDHPMAFYRLNEADDQMGNNGKLANDYIGGFFGTYSNTVLGVPGYNSTIDPDTAALFGQLATSDSLVDNIGLSFAAPAGQSKAFSIEAWVQGSSAQNTDAGIITVGYGGFEQFNLDCGAADPAHNFRFYIRDASGNTHGPDGTKSPSDMRWHHVVGVCDEANSNVVLYVDGLRDGITSGFNSGLGILSPTTPMTIGARRSSTTSSHDDQFLGSIDEVAIYSYALSSNQVLTHYYASEPPPVFTIQPTNTTANENSTAVLYSSAYGPGTLGFQWYQSSDTVTFTPIAGQTAMNLSLPNVSSAPPPSGPNGMFYQVVVTNNYGAITSSLVQLTVIGGAPTVVSDLPSSQTAIAGSTLSLSVQVAGTAPFTYQWTYNGANLSDNGRISGSRTSTLTIAAVSTSDAGAYQVQILNSQSGGTPTLSASDTLTVLPVLGLNGNGTGWQLSGTGLNAQPPQPRIGNNVLTLTDNGQGENACAYYSTPVYVGTPFMATFTYQVVGGFAGGQADGAAFVLQNDPRGPAALGGGGGTLGVGGVSPSAELELNIYPNNSYGGQGIAFNVDGGIGNFGGQNNTPTAPVVLDAGDHINVVLTYVDNIVDVTLTDAETHATFSTSYDLNQLSTDLPTILHGTTAYAGFSGADGGVASYQQVSNFRFVSLPSVEVHLAAGNTAVISWPQVSGQFTLQSRADLTTGAWQTVTTPITVVNGHSQVTVPATGAHFYRLAQQ